jgi:hypothetical protein
MRVFVWIKPGTLDKSTQHAHRKVTSQKGAPTVMPTKVIHISPLSFQGNKALYTAKQNKPNGNKGAVASQKTFR